MKDSGRSRNLEETESDRDSDSLQGESGSFETRLAELEYAEFQEGLAKGRRFHLWVFGVAFFGTLSHTLVILGDLFAPPLFSAETDIWVMGFRAIGFTIWAVLIPFSSRKHWREEVSLPFFARAELSGEFWQFLALVIPPWLAIGILYLFAPSVN
ncbi:MAG: hypothetical protein KDN19_02840 [Verrucomicrobiae bacterium]|nr:hypothetical protein [Verrucomicrobiae bacterium]